MVNAGTATTSRPGQLRPRFGIRHWEHYDGSMQLGGRISAIEPDTQQRDQIIVKVDGRVVARITPSAVAQLHLAEGLELSESLATALNDADALNRAVRQAARRLNRRALSRAETSEHLEARGFAAAVVARALEHLERLGVLDDERLGLALIEETQARRPTGPALLRRKLQQRQLIDATIDGLIADSSPSDGDAARQLAAKRLATLSNQDDATKRRRLYGLLARRGFDEDLATEVVDEVLGCEDLPSDTSG